MKKKKEVEKIEEKEENQEEEKKSKRKQAASKRRSSKKKDKAARWSGVVLFVVLIFVGFLMWVAGEVKEDRPGQQLVPRQEGVGSGQIVPSQQGKVVVE